MGLECAWLLPLAPLSPFPIWLLPQEVDQCGLYRRAWFGLAGEESVGQAGSQVSQALPERRTQASCIPEAKSTALLKVPFLRLTPPRSGNFPPLILHARGPQVVTALWEWHYSSTSIRPPTPLQPVTLLSPPLIILIRLCSVVPAGPRLMQASPHTMA